MLDYFGGKRELALLSKPQFRKLERFFRRVLETFHLKLFVYKLIMAPTQEIALHRLRKIMKNSNNIEMKGDGKKVTFISVDARHMPHTYLESGIAKSLQIRGHRPKMIICNGVLSMCSSHFTVNKPPNKWSCQNCSNFSKKFYEITQLPYATFNEFIKPDEVEGIKKSVSKMTLEECEKHIHKGVRVGFHSIASVERYFKGVIPSKDIYEPILRKELANAIITTNVAERAYKSEKPDVLVSSHGCYSSWGSFSDYFVDHKIPTYVWGSGERNTLRFVYPKSDFKKYFKEVRHENMLKPEEEKEVDSFFNRRSKGQEGQVTLYGFTDTAAEDLQKQFSFDKFEKTFVMFPNVPWDAAAMATQGAFKDFHDWVSYTIDLFKKNPNRLLIIKIHPSELYEAESEETMLDLIKNKYSPLPENIKVIPPDTTINPYSLYQFTDVGLLYTGTSGIELSMNGIPVIPSEDAHYANKGFTFDVKTKKDYSKLILGDITLSEEQKKLAKVYAYYHFIKNFVPRNFISTNNFITTGWTVSSLEGFKPGKNKYLDHICDYIINGGIYQDW